MTDDAPQRRSKLVTVTLIGSLALNALFVGFVGVHAYRRYEYRVAAGMPPRLLLQFVKRRVPASDGAIFDEAAKAREGKIAAAQAAYRQALANALMLLGQPNFDEVAFRAAVADARDKRLALADLGLDTFLDAVAHISPEGRRNLVGKLRWP